MDIKEMQELIKFKKDNPKEYKQFLDDSVDILCDSVIVAKKVFEKLEDEGI